MINNMQTLNKYSSYLAPLASMAITASTSNGKACPITAFTSVIFDKLGSMLCKKLEEHKENLNSSVATLAGVATITALNNFAPSFSKASLPLSYIANSAAFTGTYLAVQKLAPTTDILSTIRAPVTFGAALVVGNSIHSLLTKAISQKNTNLLGLGLLGVTFVGMAANDLILSNIRIKKNGSIIFLNK